MKVPWQVNSVKIVRFTNNGTINNASSFSISLNLSAAASATGRFLAGKTKDIALTLAWISHNSDDAGTTEQKRSNMIIRTDANLVPSRRACAGDYAMICSILPNKYELTNRLISLDPDGDGLDTLVYRTGPLPGTADMAANGRRGFLRANSSTSIYQQVNGTWVGRAGGVDCKPLGLNSSVPLLHSR